MSPRWAGSRFGNSEEAVAANPGNDPAQTYATLMRQDYLDYVQKFRPFEEQVLQRAQTDTSLIDTARQDTANTSALAQQISQRQRERFGGAYSPAFQQAQNRTLDRAAVLGQADAMNNARIAQREQNNLLMADLLNIGQGINRASSSQLANAASLSSQRDQAYGQAKAQSQAQTISTIGQIATLAAVANGF